MMNRIALKAEPRRTAIVFALFTMISLFLIWVLVFSVNKDCMQLNSLIRSGYDYSVTTQEPVLENDYYQFNAGISYRFCLLYDILSGNTDKKSLKSTDNQPLCKIARMTAEGELTLDSIEWK